MQSYERIRSLGRHGAVALATTFSLSVLTLLPGFSLLSSASTGNPTTPMLRVVAAENFWGNIAQQIAGRYAKVTSVISNPNLDPHSYEPTAADAREFAGADIAIVNGLGYDPWASNLLAADSVRQIINVGVVLHLPDSANPHRWYSPSDVVQVVQSLVASLSAQDPHQREYFTNRERDFFSTSLGSYHQLIAKISTGFRGVPVGASESIFSMLATSLRLRLVTPYDFLRAVSEGAEVSPADISTIDRQITSRQIWVYVYNSQNTVPEVTAQLALCKKHNVPVVAITETLRPSNYSYEKWQTTQLANLLRALQTARSQRVH